MKHIDEILNLMEKAKEDNPLVNFLVNYVTANELTSITSYFGGTPVMTDDPIDAADVVEYGQVDALVFNIGTITNKQVNAMIEAGKKATERNVPIILDPVAAGVTPFRSQAIKRMLEELKISIIKGNLAEIKACLGVETASKGVDSNEDESDADQYVVALARKYNCVVAMTGIEDIITDGARVVKIKNGTPSLPKVIGTGCTIGALVGTFSGVTDDYFYSAMTGVIIMGIAGEIADQKVDAKLGYYTYKHHLLDTLSVMTNEQIKERANILDVAIEDIAVWAS
ncbi:MAG: hydroxyethylthiazole kinase [Clostridiaceae bacterium]